MKIPAAWHQRCEAFTSHWYKYLPWALAKLSLPMSPLIIHFSLIELCFPVRDLLSFTFLTHPRGSVKISSARAVSFGSCQTCCSEGPWQTAKQRLLLNALINVFVLFWPPFISQIPHIHKAMSQESKQKHTHFPFNLLPRGNALTSLTDTL